jgi:hypothetical protein
VTVDARLASDQSAAHCAGLLGASAISRICYQYEEDSLYGPGIYGTAFAFLEGFSGLSGYGNERS